MTRRALGVTDGWGAESYLYARPTARRTPTCQCARSSAQSGSPLHKVPTFDSPHCSALFALPSSSAPSSPLLFPHQPGFPYSRPGLVNMSTIVALSALAAAAFSGVHAQTTTSVAPLADQTYAYSALVRRLPPRKVLGVHPQCSYSRTKSSLLATFVATRSATTAATPLRRTRTPCARPSSSTLLTVR